MMRQVHTGKVEMLARREMLDLVKVDGKARGIIVRNLTTGEIERYAGDAVLLGTGGYGNVYYLSTNAKNSNATALWRCYKKGAQFANPSFTQIHPTCIPVSGKYQSKLTLMSESLRNDGRVWVSKKENDKRHPSDIPDEERDYFLERRYPSFGNLVPRDVASRNAKYVCDENRGVGKTGLAVYLDFRDAINQFGENTIKAKYGNLFAMYEKITGENPYEVPMRIYPAVHFTMGGLWVDYNLSSTVPGLYVLGEANFADHGGNRLGASALMQGLADGYYVIPYTLGDYLAENLHAEKVATDHPAFDEAEKETMDRINKLLNVKGKKTVLDFHRELGELMWDNVGMSRNKEGLETAIKKIADLREEFWKDVHIPGENSTYNKYLEYALRIADFMELGELMARDALDREESCGGHFREEHQTEDGEAVRDDENFNHVSSWEFKGEDQDPVKHKEDLNFEFVTPTQRSYK
ncbi:succinate dehydrogenase (quinone) flavoprotein subunit, partial [Balneolaceae bacterium ANBcel3]|nr:succinate dehydrogenase (quinone) flavoprotein subunit [Balneolaceae bacterium ANBcel3]